MASTGPRNCITFSAGSEVADEEPEGGEDQRAEPGRETGQQPDVQRHVDPGQGADGELDHAPRPGRAPSRSAPWSPRRRPVAAGSAAAGGSSPGPARRRPSPRRPVVATIAPYTARLIMMYDAASGARCRVVLVPLGRRAGRSTAGMIRVKTRVRRLRSTRRISRSRKTRVKPPSAGAAALRGMPHAGCAGDSGGAHRELLSWALVTAGPWVLVRARKASSRLREVISRSRAVVKVSR